MSSDISSPDVAATPAGTATSPAPAAKAPVSPGATTLAGIVLALLTLGLAVVALQSAASAAGWVDGSPWLTAAIKQTDGLRARSWAPVVGVVLIVLGLWFLLAALRPRPKSAVPLEAQTGVFLRPRDLARIAEDAARDVDGVDQARAKASRRKITMDARVTGDGHVSAIEEAVVTRLGVLRSHPRVQVRARQVRP